MSRPSHRSLLSLLALALLCVTTGQLATGRGVTWQTTAGMSATLDEQPPLQTMVSATGAMSAVGETRSGGTAAPQFARRTAAPRRAALLISLQRQGSEAPRAAERLRRLCAPAFATALPPPPA